MNNLQLHPVTAARRTGPGRSSRGRSAGFSLVEVLIAMGIFAVGFVAVAAMFPAGAVLQRETVADVESQLVARNAAALVRSRRITFVAAPWISGVSDLGENSGSGFLEPFTSLVNASQKLKDGYKIGDRGYPTSQQTTNDRRYYWLPMIRRLKTPAQNKSDWIVVVFVLRRDSTHTYGFKTPPVPTGTWANPPTDGDTIPKVIGVAAQAGNGKFLFNNRLFPETPVGQPDQVRAGDFVADQDGVVYNVIDADANGCTIAGGMKTNNAATLWYAPPPASGASSPCTRVLLISGVVDEAVK